MKRRQESWHSRNILRWCCPRGRTRPPKQDSVGCRSRKQDVSRRPRNKSPRCCVPFLRTRGISGCGAGCDRFLGAVPDAREATYTGSILFLSGDPALADDILSETFIRLWHAREVIASFYVGHSSSPYDTCAAPSTVSSGQRRPSLQPSRARSIRVGCAINIPTTRMTIRGLGDRWLAGEEVSGVALATTTDRNSRRPFRWGGWSDRPAVGHRSRTDVPGRVGFRARRRASTPNRTCVAPSDRPASGSASPSGRVCGPPVAGGGAMRLRPDEALQKTGDVAHQS